MSCLLTPQRHEYREKYSGRVVKQMAGPGSSTRSTESPVAAHSVTQRTHGDVVFWVADFHTTERVKDGKRERVGGWVGLVIEIVI